MPLNPALKAMFDAQNSPTLIPEGVDPAQMRETVHAMMQENCFAFSVPVPAVATKRDLTIPVDGGKIGARLYRNISGDAILPCHVYYHGGGFIVGALEHFDDVCRRLAGEAGCVVVSVDYRLAPEHRFPIAAEDSYAALLWVVDNAGALGIDPARLSVGGVSAGGGLAAVVAQLARDRKGPPILAQVLDIPVTDFTHAQALSFEDEGITIAPEKGYGPMYLRDEADAHDPRASPLLAVTLADLPPALVICAEYDQLQPEGEAYARRLADAGVPTTYAFWEEQIHGSQTFDRLMPEEAAAYRAQITEFLRNAYADAATPGSTAETMS
ncbi:hypothetical protein ASG29_15870 [Sphingomonas sp. Leaf412]|uniref:alpha/beta hydrolase n=1 Tax=Sphingomonas sp. Leaf412 TaxID=1736370 RepID=UPI00070189AA|nr:alpha/beta hydrolase [Sphingomonas sp. Leaf412]KQT31413.1 hypothetical protein ASG29_15870 [Sphingomonas sp. Leaf412]